jgi:hypothetical protein
MAAIADIGSLERSVSTASEPPPTLSPPLRALWLAKKAGLTAAADSAEWSAAVATATDPAHGHPSETNLAWVHALLARVADDDSTASERYAAASRPAPSPGTPAADEWRDIASTLLTDMLQNGGADGPDAMAKAVRARSITDPVEYLEAIGMREIPHGSRGADLTHGSFMDHLLGVETAMRELGCGESMALAGLFHSVYGTEGFQYYTLPLSERAKVRELVGARGELAVFYNCVMDRHSLDVLTSEVAARFDAAGATPPPYGTSGDNSGEEFFFGDGYGGDAEAEAAASDRFVGYLRARPSPKTGMSGEETFALTLRELQVRRPR